MLRITYLIGCSFELGRRQAARSEEARPRRKLPDCRKNAWKSALERNREKRQKSARESRKPKITGNKTGEQKPNTHARRTEAENSKKLLLVEKKSNKCWQLESQSQDARRKGKVCRPVDPCIESDVVA